MEAVIFCGIQGSGKSTFYRERFFNTHVRLSLDMLRTRYRERIMLRACIDARQPFVVDNTNPTAEERRLYVAPAKAAGFLVVAYYFHSTAGEAIARNQGRAVREQIPVVGILGTYRRLEVPRRQEGFSVIHRVEINAEGGFSVEPLPTDSSPSADGP